MIARVASLALAAVAAWGQAQSILELARKAPPEFFADAVIKLVERGDVSSSAERRALLEEAFQAARHAREPVRFIAMPRFADGRPRLLEGAGKLGLDALSLESRVVALMAATDPDKARELFQSVEHPLLDARPCADPMIADDSAYYEMAAKVAAADAPFLMSVIGPANSPREMVDSARMLRMASALTPEQFRVVLGALSLKMGMVAPDYRSFTMSAAELRTELDGLAARARELGVPIDPLVEGARKLAVTQLSSPRCDEEFGDALPFVDWFNRTFGRRYGAIGEEETVSKGPMGSAQAESYFSTGQARQISDAFQRLRMAAGKPEWRDGLTDFLREFSEWKPEGSAIDAFHQKMTVLHGLFQLIPPGEDRDKLMAMAVDHLQSSGMEREHPAEWLLQVRAFTESALGDRSKLLGSFRKSGDAGLALFAVLNQ